MRLIDIDILYEETETRQIRLRPKNVSVSKSDSSDFGMQITRSDRTLYNFSLLFSNIKSRKTKSLVSLEKRHLLQQKNKSIRPSPYYQHPVFSDCGSKLIFERMKFRHKTFRVYAREQDEHSRLVISNATLILSKPIFIICYHDSYGRPRDAKMCSASIEEVLLFIDEWMSQYEDNTIAKFIPAGKYYEKVNILLDGN